MNAAIGQAIGYVRVSTDKQELSGLSFDAQRQAITDECDRRGWPLVAVERDTITTRKKLDKRPGLQRAFGRLEKGDALVVSRLDRLARSTIDLAFTLEQAKAGGWDLIILDPDVDTTTAFGRALLQMAAVFGELERELISQRTKESIAVKKRNGTYRNNLPEIPPDVERRIVRLAGRGNSHRRIAAMLDAAGVKPVRAERWSHRTVQKVLDRHRAAA